MNRHDDSHDDSNDLSAGDLNSTTGATSRRTVLKVGTLTVATGAFVIGGMLVPRPRLTPRDWENKTANQVSIDSVHNGEGTLT